MLLMKQMRAMKQDINITLTKTSQMNKTSLSSQSQHSRQSSSGDSGHVRNASSGSGSSDTGSFDGAKVALKRRKKSSEGIHNR
jgi:hypothetical protein